MRAGDLSTRGAPADFFVATNTAVPAAVATLTRPNNGNAYAAGQVVGPAADARLSIAVPALPAGAVVPGFSNLILLCVQHRSPADAVLPSSYLLPAGAAFTTVLGDAAAVALSDAEIATLLVKTLAMPGFTVGVGTQDVFNNTASAAAGRRGAVITLTPARAALFAPGSTLGLYLIMGAAYTPVALEAFDFYPFFLVPVKYGSRDPQRNFFSAQNMTVTGAPVTLTRPNNGNAYAAGQMFGAALDARLSLVVPALPTGAYLPGFTGLTLLVTNNRPASDALPTFRALVASSPFVTVLGDAASLALTDADIALLVPSSSTPGFSLVFTAYASGGGFNASAAPAGRRGTQLVFSPLTGLFLTPGATLSLYLSLAAAYTPIANETLTVTPVFSTSVQEVK